MEIPPSLVLAQVCASPAAMPVTLANGTHACPVEAHAPRARPQTIETMRRKPSPAPAGPGFPEFAGACLTMATSQMRDGTGVNSASPTDRRSGTAGAMFAPDQVLVTHSPN